jgi:hypothetical protein
LGLLIGGHQVDEHCAFGDAVWVLLKKGFIGLGLGCGLRLAAGVGIGVVLRRILDGGGAAVVRGALGCGSLAVSALSEGRQGDCAGTSGQRNRGKYELLHSTLLGEFVWCKFQISGDGCPIR